MNEEINQILEGEQKEPTELEKQLSSLPREELEALAKNVVKVRQAQAINPRLKFKKDQPKQMKFIDNSHFISIALCGNQFGKSFSMAFKGCSVAVGEDKDAPHQPDPARQLEILFVGPSWEKITEAIQKDVLSMLRDDEIIKKVKVNNYIKKLTVKAPNGGITNMVFMPSSVDKKEDSQEFEGSKYHYVFVDEGISPELFRKILVRLGSLQGRFYQAFTRIPENMHLAHHLIDLEKGTGEFKNLLDKGWVQIIQASTLENKYLDDYSKQVFISGQGTEQDEKLFEEYSATEDKVKKQELLEKMTENFKARILGIVDKPAGACFNFREKVGEDNYNMFSFQELLEIMSQEKGRWDLCHDYGQSAPATWLLLWTSSRTGTTYVVDEVYRANMSIQQSAEECYDMLRRWKCYGHVKCCFADKQIRDPGRKDKRTDTGVTILGQYKSKYTENGDPCFPMNMQWICRQSDKNNKQHTMALLAEMVEEENLFTKGKPYIRWSHKCGNSVKEMKLLRWSTKIHKQSGASYEDTEGHDHSIDPIRYFINNKVNYAIWVHRHKKQMEFNSLSYEVGGSGNPLFNI